MTGKQGYAWVYYDDEVRIMDCRDVDFSPTKSEERIDKALKVFPEGLLMRILAFTLHLLGAKRKAVAELVGMPEESVKTVVRVALRDGFAALRDRRRSEGPSVSRSSPSPLPIAVRREGEWYVMELGPNFRPLRIPVSFQVQARTVLLSFVNAGLLSAQETATILGMSAAHCRTLARELTNHDVEDSLVDKRRGQKKDYRVGPEQKAELIQQLAGRVMTGRSTSGDDLAEAVNDRTGSSVSARTIRWHVRKLGLTNINDTLPKLVETLKKTS